MEKIPGGMLGGIEHPSAPPSGTLVQQVFYPITLQVGSPLQQVTCCARCMTSPAPGNGMFFHYISNKICN